MNTFEEFVDGSDSIKNGVTLIARHEERRKDMYGKYIEEIAELRNELAEWEAAFKDVIVWYNAQLPFGWYVAGSFDNWLGGKACVSFINGSLTTEAKNIICIGGSSSTMQELQYYMDKVTRFINNELGE